jgi:hypothetical protein
MMHDGRGRAHPLHVEYIHLGVCLGLIQDAMTEAVMSHPRLDLKRKISICRALGKVIWVQNDLMAKWQVRDGEEFDEVFDPDDDVVIEKEGYLHGKKILDETEEEHDQFHAESPSRIPLRPSVCPFTGISADAIPETNPATDKQRNLDRP